MALQKKCGSLVVLCCQTAMWVALAVRVEHDELENMTLDRYDTDTGMSGWAENDLYWNAMPMVGDPLFTKTQSALATAIQVMDKGWASHALVVQEVRALVWPDDGLEGYDPFVLDRMDRVGLGTFVVDAVGDGVERVPLWNAITHSERYVAYTNPWEQFSAKLMGRSQHQISQWLLSQVGKEYSIKGVLKAGFKHNVLVEAVFERLAGRHYAQTLSTRYVGRRTPKEPAEWFCSQLVGYYLKDLHGVAENMDEMSPAALEQFVAGSLNNEALSGKKVPPFPLMANVVGPNDNGKQGLMPWMYKQPWRILVNDVWCIDEDVLTCKTKCDGTEYTDSEECVVTSEDFTDVKVSHHDEDHVYLFGKCLKMSGVSDRWVTGTVKIPGDKADAFSDYSEDVWLFVEEQNTQHRCHNKYIAITHQVLKHADTDPVWRQELRLTFLPATPQRFCAKDSSIRSCEPCFLETDCGGEGPPYKTAYQRSVLQYRDGYEEAMTDQGNLCRATFEAACRPSAEK